MADDYFPALGWHRAILSDRCTLDPSESLVMLAIVRHADVEGRAWPSFGTLCKVSRVGRTKLIASLAELEARALFTRHAQTRGKGLGSNSYRIPLEPPTEGLEGERRVVRQANQSTTRTSALRELGSAPGELGVVRLANGGSAPGEPYLLRELPNGTPQGTAQARKRAAACPSVRTSRRRVAESAIPSDWAPTEAHKAYAAKHGLDLQGEVDAFLGWAKGRTQISWDGTFTTRLANQAKWNRARTGTHVPLVQRGGTIREGDKSWLDAAAGGE